MDTTTASELGIVRNKPVAKFRYKGTHRSPVRRTVLLSSIGRDTFTGFEVREGNLTRNVDENVIKTFTRDKITDLERYSLNSEIMW